MQETVKKFGFCLQNHPRSTRILRLKIFQLIIQGVIALVTGLATVNKSDNCSVPIPVFLLGLFGTYIAGIALNFTVCFGRCCEYYGTDDCMRSFKLWMRGVNYIYLPLYCVFCVIEFIWYVLGAYWYYLKGDCDSQFSTGYSMSIGLVAFYFILLFIYLVVFVAILCYLRCNEVETPKPEEKKPAENTLDPRLQAQGWDPQRPAFAQNDPRYAADYNPGSYAQPYDNQPYYPQEPVPQPYDPRFAQGYPGYNVPDNARYPNYEGMQNYNNHPLAPR
jgi:hypothetical protein